VFTGILYPILSNNIERMKAKRERERIRNQQNKTQNKKNKPKRLK
jgi:hypothetical protein